MDNFHDKFKKIKAFVFDVDGVLSKDTTTLNSEGDPARTSNVKDGFALRHAVNEGYLIAIMTAAKVERVKLRYQKLGVKHYFDGLKDKAECLVSFLSELNLSTESVLFMGDDLMDLKAMKLAGISACPADAVPEIEAISNYISGKKGGEGCVREIIEIVLKAQGKWVDIENIHSTSI